MPDNTDARMATADVLTHLLHNQYALACAFEEVALWARASGSNEAHENAVTALEMPRCECVRNRYWNSQAPPIIAIKVVDLSGSAAAIII